MSETRIFLSSTFVDLKTARSQIREWLQNVFELSLVVMETFGSDSAPPDVNSVRRVREAEVFVGIYGFRYGQIEPTSGKSITELELDEAERMQSAGLIRDILIYKASDRALWLKEHGETDTRSQELVQRLRDRISSHTYTQFSKQSELVRSVVRDVYRAVQRTASAGPRIRSIRLPLARKLHQPVGMEFLQSSDRDYLLGRDELLFELAKCLDTESIVLLLGESGAGKTSLIHAGVFPELTRRGDRILYTRPLGYPCTDVLHQLCNAVFEARSPVFRSLKSALQAVLAALTNARVVLVIDQFEDVLSARDSGETERLIGELSELRREPLEGLRILISYRADLEGRLGQNWQRISGSPSGLARVYVDGIAIEAAWKGAIQELNDLGVTLLLSTSEEEQIKSELLALSTSAGMRGVYPPYLQMLIEHFWHSASSSSMTYSMAAYQKVEGMDGVIGGYLSRMLGYANDASGHVRRVLVTLVKSYGVKAQRGIPEIAAESNLSEEDCETALEKLIDLRLVRHLDDEYEIAHDFIARKVASELVDSDEREYKRFRELLATKAAAYGTTQNTLTSEEMLMLFKRRKALVPSDSEGRLLTRSWLDGRGPALCWLVPAGKSKLLSWIQAEAETATTEKEERSISLVLAGAWLGHPDWESIGTSILRRYRRSIEIVGAIKNAPSLTPAKVLQAALCISTEVKSTASKVIFSRLIAGEWHWLAILRDSKRRGHNELFMRAVFHPEIPVPTKQKQMAPAIREFAGLKELIHGGPTAFTKLSPENIRTSLSRELAKAIKAVQNRTFVKRLGRLLSRGNYGLPTTAMIAAAPLINDASDQRALLNLFREFLPPKYRRAQLVRVGEIIRSLPVQPRRVTASSELGRLLKTAPLTPEIFAATIANCEDARIFEVLASVADAKEDLRFQGGVQLARQLEIRSEKMRRRLPRKWIQEINKKEFWEYVGHDQRRRTEYAGHLLNLRNPQNRPLYVRLLGHAAVGTSTVADVPMLRRLTAHYFESISKSAVLKLNALVGERLLDVLTENIDASVKAGEAEAAAETLRFAEMVAFGLVPQSVREEYGF